MTVFKDYADSSAVIVRNAFKSYGNFNVIKGLNLNVQNSTIYGLLGPSGCGKTTLLSCIVNRLSLDHGSITLNAKTVSDVGYMPQDVSLHEELSIREIFYYYGYIYGLTEKQIKYKMSELLSFLELPNQNRICTTLSGGQQRRVSFAVALLHDPKLLILDEPTVGLDPVLAHSIWERLIEMSKVGKTIVITTHYIEEAKQADTVGLMRSGNLLAEDSPSNLLSYYNCSTLEDAFLYLCEQDQSNNNNNSNEQPSSCDKLKCLPTLEQSTILVKNRFSFSRFKAQLIKNLYQVRRNKEITAFMLILPIVICVFFNMAIGHDPTNLTVGYVNEEVSSCNNVTYKGCAFTENIYSSCQVLEELRSRSFNLVEYNNTNEAQAAMYKNKAWGVLYFAPNYTRAVVERINLGQGIKKGSLDVSTLSFWIDKSDKYISTIVQRDVVFSLLETINKIVEPCAAQNIKVNPKIVANPIRFHQAIYGTNEPTFSHFATPAALCICIFYLPVIFTGATINGEKEGGVIERVMAAGMSFFEVAIAHSVVQFVLMVIQAAEMMAIMYIVYDNPYNGSILTGFSLLIVVGCGGSVFGFILAVLSKNLAGACFFGIGSNFLLMCVCGFIWPAEGAHYLLRLVNSYFPLTLAATAMRSITIRGWTITHPVIYMGFVASVVWLIVFFIVALIVLKIRDDIWRRK